MRTLWLDHGIAAVRCFLPSAFCLLLSAFCLPAFAQPGMPQPSSPLYGQRPGNGPVQKGLPPALQNVGIDQKLNQQVPLDLTFRDENGQTVKLGQYFGKRPVVLSLVYYSCPMLCTQVLNGMVGAFKTLAFVPGEQYEVVTVSFDPRETPALAAEKKRTLRRLPAAGQAPGRYQRLAFPDWRRSQHQAPDRGSRFSLSVGRCDQTVRARQRHHGPDAGRKAGPVLLRH